MVITKTAPKATGSRAIPKKKTAASKTSPKKTATAPKKTAGSKAGPKKTAAKSIQAASKRPAKKTTARPGKGVQVGAGYECSVCGLAVSVDKECGCVDTCDIVCCGEPMQKK